MTRLIEDRLGERGRVYGRERAILAGVVRGRTPQEREIMEELIALSRTAGIDVVRVMTQRRSKPDPSTFIGHGKAEQLQAMAAEAQAGAVIFNDSLAPAQGRNLEELIGVKIIDRAQLILDIFAQRAQSVESKLQVELAQLEYLLPRLRGWGEALSQMGGGIGTRGPGETKLEMERQAIKRRIHKIRDRLEEAATERRLRRKGRARRDVFEIALIGYTNTGKSTLLRELSGAQTQIEDKLFATLDTKVRRYELPDRRVAVLTDTVGFIRQLPHQLVPAFHATLESAREADLLLNVLDVTSKGLFDQWTTIQRVLSELFDEGPRPPMINVLNKIDGVRSAEDRRRLRQARIRIAPLVEISAREGENLGMLGDAMARALGSHRERVRVEIPYTEASLVGKLYGWGRVRDERYEAEAIVVEAELDRSYIATLEKLIREKGNGISLTRKPG